MYGTNNVQGYHIGVRELEEMGAKFCEALIDLPSTIGLDSSLITKTLNILESEDTLSEDGEEGSSVASDASEGEVDTAREKPCSTAAGW